MEGVVRPGVGNLGVLARPLVYAHGMKSARERCEYWRGASGALLLSLIATRWARVIPEHSWMDWAFWLTFAAIWAASFGYSVYLNRAAVAEQHAAAGRG